MYASALGKLTFQDKAERTTKQVPFAFPVFVVWQGEGEKRKGNSALRKSLADAFAFTFSVVESMIVSLENMSNGASFDDLWQVKSSLEVDEWDGRDLAADNHQLNRQLDKQSVAMNSYMERLENNLNGASSRVKSLEASNANADANVDAKLETKFSGFQKLRDDDANAIMANCQARDDRSQKQIGGLTTAVGQVITTLNLASDEEWADFTQEHDLDQ
ncbi:hypothetical protein ACHAPU_002617 [Fusarium lateritium]